MRLLCLSKTSSASSCDTALKPTAYRSVSSIQRATSGMSSSKTKMYHRLHYYTTSPDDIDAIDKWFGEQDFGPASGEQFYACFINWCIPTLDRARTSTSSVQGSAEDQRAVAVLTTFPADTAKFVGLLKWYLVREFDPEKMKKGVVNVGSPSSKLFHSDLQQLTGRIERKS